MPLLGGKNRDSPFFGVLVRDLGNYSTTLACNRALVKKKRNVLVKQVPSVPGKDDLFLRPTAVSFLYGEVNVPEGFRPEGLGLVETGNNKPQGGKLTGPCDFMRTM